MGGVGIGRCGVLGVARRAAVLLLLGAASLIGRAGGQIAVEEVAVARKVPYIGGVWEFEYTYNELRGPADNLIQNPCQGPFPYRYTWEVHIYQLVETDINGATLPRETANQRHAPAPSSHPLLRL
ncbi:hypothetical protein T484DRAFT_1764408 [Baffinella frigidus]|nr:hypothetical protein T484DRAFT_1764408 [Cryptophyta sp. CCMP2293]